VTQASLTRDPVRRRGAWPFDGSRLGAVSALVILVVLGLVLRAFIAGYLLRSSGFRIDIGDFTAWAHRLATGGPGAFYAPDYFSDYPPGYLYVLWGVGALGDLVRPVFGTDITSGLVKIPGILADGGVAVLLFLFCRRFLDGRLGRSGALLGLAAAAIYLFNPGTIFNSAVWGQVDAVGTLVILGTLYALAAGWTELAALGAVVALLIKFQYGFLIPIVAVVGLRRHLLGRSADPEHDRRPDGVRVLTSLAAGIGSLVVLIAPFNLSVWAPNDPTHSLVGKFVDAANTYHGLSINAFNIWRNPWSGLGDTNQWGCDGPSLPVETSCNGGVAFLLGGHEVTWQLIGLMLFAVVAVVALWQVARRDDTHGVLLATLLLAVAFFVLPTRVHERYLFPALALAAPLAVPFVRRNWRWGTLYAVLSISFFLNVYWTYTLDWSYVAGPPLNPGVDGLPMARDPLLAVTLLSDWGIYFLAALITLALLWLVHRSYAVGMAGDGSRRPAVWPPPAVRVALDAPAAELAPVSLGARFGWLRSNRLDPLLREPMRRLDRLDLALVIGFVVFAFVFRLWRLDIPRSMHFDEVYHARSATEWLSDWEHGWTRDTYEWTHPMLAKYLIAAGIMVADPNKVEATVGLDAPAAAMAVIPRYADGGHPRSVVFLGLGDTIIARDALSGEQVASWSNGAPVASLAYDPYAQRLLVGSTTGGEVKTYATDAFMQHAGSRAPPPPQPPIATELGSVLRIVVPWRDDVTQPVPTGEDVVLLAGAGGIVEIDRPTGGVIATSDVPASDVGYLAPDPDDASVGARVVAIDPAQSRVVVLEAATLVQSRTLELPAPPAGTLLIHGSGSDAQLWVPVGALPANDEHPAVDGGLTVFNDSLSEIDTVALPGPPARIAWQDSADVVYIAGSAPDGTPQVWTIDPLGDERSGFAAYDTTALPAEATAMVADDAKTAEGDDNANLLVATAGNAAQLVTIDAGSNAFSWRLAGIVFGSLLVGLIYLLAATMFRRRRIAVLAAAFVAVDGMSYVMSRIAMNDIYVAVFIVAAYLVFWQIWSGRWARSAWWALPLVGVLIGLAAATKWVGWYALIGLLVLVLARSGLGRLLLVVAVAFLTAVAGIGAPWPFLAVMILGLLFALLVVWVRPIRIRLADLVALPASGVVAGGIGLALAIGYQQVEGRKATSAVELLFGFLARGAQAGWPAWIMLGVAAALLAWRPIASLRDPTSDRKWMQPSSLAGFGWSWILACLVIVPLAVYFVSYIPYLQLGHSIALAAGSGPGYGWSLDELQAQMFGYHFGLQAGHPSSSPWWSWPLDLKPVWFYGNPGAWNDRVGAAIYNGGNPILFWAGIPALLYCAMQAWRRRSLALVLIVAAFAFQFLPWTRIERATFHYHYFTAVLFAMIAVAYAVDELLRSWEWRSLGIAFLVAAGIAGVLVFPLGSALVMPDWYLNAARALPPWNYNFQFPNPPQGEREGLLVVNSLKLVLGLVLAVAAGLFAIFGQRLLAPLLVRMPSRGGDEQGDTGEHQQYRPEAIPGDDRDVVP
jgi:predicted membrane-bound dolichyl-phosphate-mannose-protein mannosyltransferase/Gpi18-like mannosyltransferase